MEYDLQSMRFLLVSHSKQEGDVTVILLPRTAAHFLKSDSPLIFPWPRGYHQKSALATRLCQDHSPVHRRSLVTPPAGGKAPHVSVFGRSRVALLQRVHL